MKKCCIILIFGVLLQGCATYRVQQGGSAYGKGFVVSRNSNIIPEYTVGADNAYPAQEIAKERFNRRRKRVESYYKRMGFMDSRFKQFFIEPPSVFFGFIAGIFRLPFIALSDYKYNNDPVYKEKMDQLEDAEYNAERERVNKIKDELKAYIKEDLNSESLTADTVSSLKKESVAEGAVKPLPSVDKTAIIPQPVKEGAKAVSPEAAKPVKEEAIKQKPAAKIEAVICLKPQTGPSPLKVNFSAAKSFSSAGRITSYSWDFGDGDKSNKRNTSNTYWSTTYGTREYTVTLNVTDSNGNTASSSALIRVVNR